jgi:hypothetical protein
VVDVGNLNIVDAPVSQVSMGESEMDDIYGLNNVIDDLMKEKGGKDVAAIDKVIQSL